VRSDSRRPRRPKETIRPCSFVFPRGADSSIRTGQTSVFEPPRAVRNRAWWWTRSKTFGSLSQIAKAMTGTIGTATASSAFVRERLRQPMSAQRRRKERSALARLSSREGLIHPSEPGQASVFEPPRAVRNRAWWWTRSKQQPWKRKFAARDFRQDAPGIALRIAGPTTETGPWRGKLRKCRAILWRRKSRRFARTTWWS
jgi:hypothetical protein